jgi:hypothetical protein
MSDSLPYQKHSATSKAAAKAFTEKAPGARYRVLDYICDHGPCSDLQIQQGLMMGGNTQRPRRIELESAGHIKPVGTVSDEKGTGRVVYVDTGKPYPSKPPKGYWDSTMRKLRAGQPTPEEFAELVVTVRKARKVLSKDDFTAGSLKVMRWILKQAKD